MRSHSTYRAAVRAGATVVAAGFLSCFLLGAAGASTVRHAVTFDDLVSLIEITELDQTSDGTSYAYSTRGGEIGVVMLTAGQWKGRTVGRGRSARFSPDGRTLAFLDREEQLQLLDLDSGTLQPLFGSNAASPHKPRAYSWSPSGDQILFTAAGPARLPGGVQRAVAAEGRPMVLTERSPAGWALAGLRLGSEMPTERGIERLYVAKIADKSVRELPTGEGRHLDPDWSRDGMITYIWMDAVGPVGMSKSSELRTFDPRTGVVQILVKTAGQVAGPRWSPDGNLIAFRPGPAVEERVIRVVALDGTPERKIPADPGTYDSDFAWYDSQHLLTVSVQEAAIQILRVEVGSGRREIVAAERSVGRYPCVAGGLISWVESSGSAPSVIRQRKMGEDTRTVFDPNPQVSAWLLGTQEVIHYRNQHGFGRTGVLITPPGAQPGAKYPLVVSCYPYPFHSNGFHFQMAGYADQTWASRGYAVFYPRPHMPKHWYSAINHPDQKESMRGPKGWEVTVDDVLSGVDEVARRGLIDPERIGLLGHSNGGEVIAFLLTKSHRFKCAALLSPVGLNYVDWALYEDVGPIEATGPRERAIWTESVGSGTLWENSLAFFDYSSVFRLDRVRTPVLIAVGDRDSSVCLSAAQAFLALRRHGKQVTFLRYEGQGHVLVGNARRDFAARSADFFDTFLGPDIR